MATISALPAPPTRADPDSFNDRADGFLSHLEATFAPELNALRAELLDVRDDTTATADLVAGSASQAAGSALVAQAASAAAQSLADAPVWNAATDYALGALAVDPADWEVYRRTDPGTSAANPASDPNRWDRVTTGFQAGDVLLSARPLAAPAWLPCNGSVYLQGSYPLLFARLGILSGSQAASTWTLRSNPIQTVVDDRGDPVSINAVTFGNGLFVASAEQGAIATSPDGITWTLRTSGFGATSISAVTYGNGLFVAAGASGKLATSPDGITWTLRTSGFGTTAISAVAYGNGLFVAAGASGKLATSPDGITWTLRTSGFGADAISAVAYGNGLFVAAGASGKLATSPDGITWTLRTSIFTSIKALTYGNGLFVASPGGSISISPDGITWTTRTSGFGISINAVTYGNGLFVAAGGSAKLATSTVGYDPATQFATPVLPPPPLGLKYYIKAR